MVWRAASDPYRDAQHESDPAAASPRPVTPVTPRPPPPGMPLPPRTVPIAATSPPMGVPPATRREPGMDHGQTAPLAPPPIAPPSGQVSAPSRVPPTSRPVMVQGRRVRHVIQQIDPWTVLRLSILFYLCVLLVLLVAGVVLWNIASAFGVLHNFEKFIRQLFDLQSFKLHPSVALEAFAIGGVLLVLLGTALNVIAAFLYNLISDVAGGIQVTISEDQTP